MDSRVRTSTAWWWKLWFGTDPDMAMVACCPAPATAQAWGSSGFDSGEVLIGAVDSAARATTMRNLVRKLGPDDSGEVVIEPFLSDGGSASGWGTGTMSSPRRWLRPGGSGTISGGLVAAGQEGRADFGS